MKISIGSAQRRKQKLAPQVLDVNTTQEFGFFQPMCGCLELVPNSSVTVNQKSFVRFHAMVRPTFGRVTQKTFHYCVPIPHIWHAYESFLSGQPYAGANATYVPQTVPSVPVYEFLHCVMALCDWSIYEVKTNQSGFHTPTYIPMPAQSVSTSFHDMLSPLSRNVARHAYGNPYVKIANYQISLDNYDFIIRFSSGAKEYAAVAIMTLNAQRLSKVFKGLGYQLTNSSKPVSILPIIAYHKAYFDNWYPKRFNTWKNSPAFSLMEKIEQNNYGLTDIVADFGLLFSKVLFDTTTFYYRESSDFYSSQIPNTAIHSQEDNIQTPFNNNVNTVVRAYSDTNAAIDSGPVTDSALRALRFLTKYTNKNTVIGGKIHDFLKANYGAHYLEAEDSYYLGSSITPISISDVMSTAGTDYSLLGEYAGSGTGYNGSNEKLHFNTNTFCYYINMSTVVPDTKFTQGLSPSLFHLKKFDFYTPDLDGLSLVPVPKVACLSDSVMLEQGMQPDSGTESMGFQSLYAEYKSPIIQSISSGDFSRNSLRNEYLPFYLDKFVKPMQYVPFPDSAVGTLYGRTGDMDFIKNTLLGSPELSYVNKYPQMANYNRIFYVSSERSDTHVDQILSHNVLEYDIIAPVLPISESYDTDGFSNGLKVEHA